MKEELKQELQRHINSTNILIDEYATVWPQRALDQLILLNHDLVNIVDSTTDRDSIVEKCVEAVKSVAGEKVLYSSGETMIGRINVTSLRTALRTVLNPEG